MKSLYRKFIVLFLVLILFFSLVPASPAAALPPSWTGNPDPYNCNVDLNCYWTLNVCESGSYFTIGIWGTPESRNWQEELESWGYRLGECIPESKSDSIFSGASFDLYYGYCGAFLSNPYFYGSAILTQVFWTIPGLDYHHYPCEIEYYDADGKTKEKTGTFGYVYFNLDENQQKQYLRGEITLYDYDWSSWEECTYLYYLPNEGDYGRLSCLTDLQVFAVGGK